MVRRFDEPIQVRVGEVTGEPTVDSPVAGSPAAFLWRGRVYAVRAVDGHWKERRAWWRSDREPSGVTPSAVGPSAVTTGTEPAPEAPTMLPGGDRRVWRVRAQAGRAGTPGVYELGLDGPATTGAWVLLCAHD